MASHEIIDLPKPNNYSMNPNRFRPISIVVVSDTHDDHEKYTIPDGDILLHCGDFSNKRDWPATTSINTVSQSVIKFNKWLGNLPHRHKIVICGNHDLGFRTLTKDEIESNILTNCIYLKHEMIKVEGISIYGSPWAFSENRRSKWALIPDNVDILMTHEPPQYILDLAYQPRQSNSKPPCSACGNQIHGVYEHWGLDSLAAEIRNRIRPKVHCFGHVHDSPGYKYFSDIGTMFINAAGDLTKKCYKFTYYVDLQEGY